MSVGVDSIEGINVHGGAKVVGLRLRRKYCIDALVNEYTGTMRIEEVRPPSCQEK